MFLIRHHSWSRPSTTPWWLWVEGLVVGFRWLTSPFCSTQKMVETQRQNVRTEFERLRCLLVEEEQRLLQRLEEEELEVLPPLQESVARLGQQSTQLADLVAELEGRCQLPALGLLQVNMPGVGTWAGTDGGAKIGCWQRRGSPGQSKPSDLGLFWTSCVLPVKYWGEGRTSIPGMTAGPYGHGWRIDTNPEPH